MSDFLYLFRNGNRPGSPEEMQKQMERWSAWMKDLQTKGHLKEPGHPLEPTGRVVRGNGKGITDGPYAEAKDVIGGYTLIQAKDLAQAVELSSGCPIFHVGGEVIVRPIMPFSM